VKLEVSPTARRQLLALAAWWREYRPAARVRVEDALEAAVAAMAEHPGLGRTYSQDPLGARAALTRGGRIPRCCSEP